MRPRPGTVHDVGDDHRGQGPPLEMLALQAGIDRDPAAVGGDPHAQFDVLDAGAGVALVKPADVEEDRSADRTAARPECAGSAWVRHVRVVVEQIPKGADDALVGRIVIVGTKHADKIGIGVKSVAHASDGVGGEFDVGVDEEQDFAPSRLRRQISGDCRT